MQSIKGAQTHFLQRVGRLSVLKNLNGLKKSAPIWMSRITPRLVSHTSGKSCANLLKQQPDGVALALWYLSKRRLNASMVRPNQIPNWQGFSSPLMAAKRVGLSDAAVPPFRWFHSVHLPGNGPDAAKTAIDDHHRRAGIGITSVRHRHSCRIDSKHLQPDPAHRGDPIAGIDRPFLR